MKLFKLSLLLHKLYNEQEPKAKWTSLNFNQRFSSRSNLFGVVKTNQLRVGLNIAINRMSILNNMLPLDWMNLSYTVNLCVISFVATCRSVK